MAASEPPKEILKAENPAILSKGASLALGNVFKRLVDSETRKRTAEQTRKRPKTAILGQNEQVEKALAEQAEERKRLKKAKKERIAFENNARVIPDAATGAALEKEFLATATKGAVALFNAVSKAQKSLDEEEDVAKNKKKGPPVSRESFMEIMRASLKNSAPGAVKRDRRKDVDNEDEDKSEGDANVVRSKASWLKDDYMTKGSSTLKDWDRRKDEKASDEDSESDAGNPNQADDADDISCEDSSDGSTSS
ncbi:Ribosomal RNA-processing protein [Gracilaria domingensis]|nr:Ribosomal RNA-processing protein [Gracilaria domingensis]